MLQLSFLVDQLQYLDLVLAQLCFDTFAQFVVLRLLIGDPYAMIINQRAYLRVQQLDSSLVLCLFLLDEVTPRLHLVLQFADELVSQVQLIFQLHHDNLEVFGDDVGVGYYFAVVLLQLLEYFPHFLLAGAMPARLLLINIDELLQSLAVFAAQHLLRNAQVDAQQTFKILEGLTRLIRHSILLLTLKLLQQHRDSVISQMLEYNPFTERHIPTTNATNYAYDRRYFPDIAKKSMKPGFLVTSQIHESNISSSIASPFHKLTFEPGQSRSRNNYAQNPFHKAHLLQDSHLASSARLYASDYDGHFPRSYGFYSSDYLYQSQVRVINQPAELYRKPNSPKVNNYDHLKEDGGYKKRSYTDNYDARPNIDQTINMGTGSYNNGIMKKKSSEIHNLGFGDRQSSPMDEDTLYNPPSFNMKHAFKKQDPTQPDSPRWRYPNPNEGVQTYPMGQSVGYGVQASNRARAGVKNQLNYKGVTFYLLETAAEV